MSDSDAFYAGVPVFRGFRSLMDPALYSALPDDWTVGIADVVHWPIVAAEIAAALNRCSQLTGPEAKPPPNSSRGAYWLAH